MANPKGHIARKTQQQILPEMSEVHGHVWHKNQHRRIMHTTLCNFFTFNTTGGPLPVSSYGGLSLFWGHFNGPGGIYRDNYLIVEGLMVQCSDLVLIQCCLNPLVFWGHQTWVFMHSSSPQPQLSPPDPKHDLFLLHWDLGGGVSVSKT